MPLFDRLNAIHCSSCCLTNVLYCGTGSMHHLGGCGTIDHSYCLGGNGTADGNCYLHHNGGCGMENGNCFSYYFCCCGTADEHHWFGLLSVVAQGNLIRKISSLRQTVLFLKHLDARHLLPSGICQ